MICWDGFWERLSETYMQEIVSVRSQKENVHEKGIIQDVVNIWNFLGCLRDAVIMGRWVVNVEISFVCPESPTAFLRLLVSVWRRGQSAWYICRNAPKMFEIFFEAARRVYWFVLKMKLLKRLGMPWKSHWNVSKMVAYLGPFSRTNPGRI